MTKETHIFTKFEIYSRFSLKISASSSLTCLRLKNTLCKNVSKMCAYLYANAHISLTKSKLHDFLLQYKTTTDAKAKNLDC